MPLISDKLPKIWYGGDYNPDQWPREIWQEDLHLFGKAHIDVATLPVFSWALLQPDEDRYDFAWLDEIVDRLATGGVKVCMATSTAAHPAWMARRYPDILRVDFEGRKRKYGGRHKSCPNSPTYRLYAPRLAGKLAERYAAHDALVAWHISNEYSGYCYCENCASAFRTWLQKRYGTLQELNRRWYTAFWSHTFSEWEEIVPPNMLTEYWRPDKPQFQTIALDYNRFQSESLQECLRLERDAIRRHSPDVAITTNFMHAYKPLDYAAWAKDLDVISWDSYPSNRTHPAEPALWHDLMRGLKDGKPFMLMETTPSQVNWQQYCPLKKPGMMRLHNYQAVAHGADTVMFFQLRQSLGASEKFHGAVISHAGHAETRVFREVSVLGAELQRLGDTLVDARVEAQVAILFDWENWWAMENSDGPSADWTYMPQVTKYHRALWEQNIPVDLITTETDLMKYKVLVAPSLYMLHPGYASRIETFVAAGGTFVTTFMSGMVDENDLVVPGGYPGELRRVTGIWVEEFDGLYPDERNAIACGSAVPALAGTHEAGLICSVIHAETAEVMGTYTKDFYQGTPALTRNRFGTGTAWYIGADPEPRLVSALLHHLCEEQGIRPLLVTPDKVEVTRRSKQGREFLFVLNHNAEPVQVNLGTAKGTDLLTGRALGGLVEIDGYGVVILEQR